MSSFLLFKRKCKSVNFELEFCEINDAYIKYLNSYDKRVPLPKQKNQLNNRKYIGVLFSINNINYFVNLSSYKPYKHDKMNESVDFIKIGTYAVINLNNMIPVPNSEIIKININKEEEKYKNLLLRERRIIKKRKNDIYKNSQIVYKYKLMNNENSSLAKRCCDFKLLESVLQKWISSQIHKTLVSSVNTNE